MGFKFDLSGLTAGEIRDLGGALGCKTLQDIQARIADVDESNVPLDMLVPILWLSRRASEPGFTLEMAENLPMDEFVRFHEQRRQDAETSGKPKHGTRAASATTQRRAKLVKK